MTTENAYTRAAEAARWVVRQVQLSTPVASSLMLLARLSDLAATLPEGEAERMLKAAAEELKAWQ